jgi:hypothetical protein
MLSLTEDGVPFTSTWTLSARCILKSGLRYACAILTLDYKPVPTFATFQ